MVGRLLIGSLLLSFIIGSANCQKKECEFIKKTVNCVWDAYAPNKAKAKAGEELCKSAKGAEAWKKCTNVTKDQLKDCFKFPSETIQAAKNLNMLLNGMKSLCENSGQKVTEFVDKGGQKCLDELKEDFKGTCNSSVLLYYTFSTNDKEFCDAQGNSFKCLLNHTASANTTNCNADAKAVITNFINSVRKDSPCNAAYTFQLSALAILLALLLHLNDYAAPKTQ